MENFGKNLVKFPKNFRKTEKKLCSIFNEFLELTGNFEELFEVLKHYSGDFGERWKSFSENFEIMYGRISYL